ncbi:beta-ketoacyl synthase N-terminal-like domain-containing protein [Acidicapsa ligni]|uniref:beta-ketoacyl synthase N-terminal-like domain-containing protein n=1 Tax=Acidicapsa ligni TaxID=542300 RepID=UPI0021DFF57A|nr:beta-ketoacyl synthase N-terminal-like domain-containing protein [Acidicapsa ligni]
MQQSTDPVNSAELSPVKRALIEIRQLRTEIEQTKRAQHEPIAIVGMALRLPGGVTTPESFWQALAEGKDLITPIPSDRWEARDYLNADPDHPGTMYDAHGGFISGVDEFDAEFFGINAREAASMDPQHRILLELTWEALERANINPKGLANTAGGVFIGMGGSDYARQSMRDARDMHAYSAVGSAMSIASGRISYFLNLRGPSMIVDTACSSSLVAVHLASESLRRGEINLAIVGGANLMLSPDFNVSFARTRMLAKDGHCKTFDAAADGYVRAEGCCVIVLKRLSDAVNNGDPILATVAGSAINQDGRSAGITAPNGPSQEAVIRAALENGGVEPSLVSYVEAHGTGTPLGDPIEVQALGAVYGVSKSVDSPLYIGSVKTNLGHTEAAAGLAGLIKVVLMMQPGHGIAPHLHLKNPNPKIDFARLNIDVPTQRIDWPVTDQPIYAGLSSFGFSGTNAHLLLSSSTINSPKIDGIEEQESLLVFSAVNEKSLRSLAQSYIVFLGSTKENFADICFTAAVGRAMLSHRLSIRANTASEAMLLIERWLSNGNASAVTLSTPDSTPANKSDITAPVRVDVMRHRVDLPLYPFQRTSFWFEAAPEIKRTQERERMWQAAIFASERQSNIGPLGWKLERYPRKWDVLHELTLAHAQDVFVTTGALQASDWMTPDEIIAKAGILPIYRNLITRWLTGLVVTGVVIESNQQFKATSSFNEIDLEPHWKNVECLLDDDPGALGYLRQCGKLLREVITGKISALETIFPDGSFSLAEGLYERGTIARYFNSIAASAIVETTRTIGQRRNARILEIGGGTGGTTSAVLPLLDVGQVEYWFTDLSDLFLARARNKFSAYPFMHYSIFDLDRALEEQGIGGGQFDVILAANVVHASRNLDTALSHIRSLLAPGGLLVMLESTHHHSWFDMTTGLIEGWQHFEDDRQDNPLLKPEQWRGVIERNGFIEMAVFPARDLPTSTLGQHVLLVRAPAITTEATSSSIFMHGLAEWKRSSVTEPKGVEADSNWELASTLQQLTPTERQSMMLDFVRTTIQRVFQLSVRPEELGTRDRLSDLGMDSLIALELRAELVKGLGTDARVSSTIAFDTGTVGELANALLLSIEPASDDTEETSPIIDHHNVKSTPVTAEQLSEMSEEEVEKLLNERLSKR